VKTTPAGGSVFEWHRKNLTSIEMRLVVQGKPTPGAGRGGRGRKGGNNHLPGEKRSYWFRRRGERTWDPKFAGVSKQTGKYWDGDQGEKISKRKIIRRKSRRGTETSSNIQIKECDDRLGEGKQRGRRREKYFKGKTNSKKQPKVSHPVESPNPSQKNITNMQKRKGREKFESLMLPRQASGCTKSVVKGG